jgi:hypothetical protein
MLTQGNWKARIYVVSSEQEVVDRGPCSKGVRWVGNPRGSEESVQEAKKTRANKTNIANEANTRSWSLPMAVEKSIIGEHLNMQLHQNSQRERDEQTTC